MRQQFIIVTQVSARLPFEMKQTLVANLAEARFHDKLNFTVAPGQLSQLS